MAAPNPPSGAALEDALVFADEAHELARVRTGGAWRVMIVDDDADVHSTTTFALGGLEVHGRPLEFVHAHSRAQAERLLDEERDLAVILLDVVMEQADAGLQLVRHIRDTLGMRDVRIILRTGQPGYAAAIARCAAERRNLVRDAMLTLHLPGKSGADFVAWMPLARPLDPLKRGLLEVFASSVAVSLDNVALMTDLQRAAFYDPLTGLPNRTRLVELVEASLQATSVAAPVLCLVDIDP